MQNLDTFDSDINDSSWFLLLLDNIGFCGDNNFDKILITRSQSLCLVTYKLKLSREMAI